MKNLAVALLGICHFAVIAPAQTNSAPLLLNPKYSIPHQRTFVIDCIHQLANPTNQKCLSIPQLRLGGPDEHSTFSFGASDARIPISTNGWFQFLSHSWHSDNHRSGDTAIGDLSIGRDHAGAYYFSRSHVCGLHYFHVGSSKAYASMRDFLTRNPAWQPIADIDKWRTSNKTLERDE